LGHSQCCRHYYFRAWQIGRMPCQILPTAGKYSSSPSNLLFNTDLESS